MPTRTDRTSEDRSDDTATMPDPSHGAARLRNPRSPSSRAQDPDASSISPLAVALLVAVPFVATLLATANGPGMSPDSVTYASTAEHLARGEGLTTMTGDPLTVFPPGFPVLLAAGELLGAGVELTARILNAVAFALSVLLGHVLLRRWVDARSVVLGGTAALAVSVALLQVADMAWSEPLFVLTCLAAVLAIEHASDQPRRPGALAVVVVLCWVAFLLRYAGIALVPIAAVALLCGRWRSDRRLAVLDAAAVGLGASLVPVLWMLRNHSVDGTLMGPRSASSEHVVSVLADTLSTLGEWLIPRAGHSGQLLGGLAAVLVGALVVVLLRTGHDPGARPRDRAPIVLVVFVAGYVGYLLCAALTTAFDPVNSRLMSPVYVPTVVLACVALDRLRRNIDGATIRYVRVAVVLLLVLQAAAYVQVVRADGAGQGYRSGVWERSQLVAEVASLGDDAVVFSNEPDALWARTRRQGLRWTPAEFAYRSNDRVELGEDVVDAAACSEAYLAWFEPHWRRYLLDVGQLRAAVHLEPVVQVDDGQLYRLHPVRPVDCP